MTPLGANLWARCTAFGAERSRATSDVWVAISRAHVAAWHAITMQIEEGE